MFRSSIWAALASRSFLLPWESGKREASPALAPSPVASWQWPRWDNLPYSLKAEVLGVIWGCSERGWQVPNASGQRLSPLLCRVTCLSPSSSFTLSSCSQAPGPERRKAFPSLGFCPLPRQLVPPGMWHWDKSLCFPWASVSQGGKELIR